jgi:hypothetical protein
LRDVTGLAFVQTLLDPFTVIHNLIPQPLDISHFSRNLISGIFKCSFKISVSALILTGHTGVLGVCDQMVESSLVFFDDLVLFLEDGIGVLHDACGHLIFADLAHFVEELSFVFMGWDIL